MTVVIWNDCLRMRGVYHSKWSPGYIITLPVSRHQKQKERIAIVSQQNNSTTTTTAAAEPAFYPGAACLRPRLDSNSLVWITAGGVLWCGWGVRVAREILSEFSCKNRSVKNDKTQVWVSAYSFSGCHVFFFFISHSFHRWVSISPPCNIYSSLSLNTFSKLSAE